MDKKQYNDALERQRGELDHIEQKAKKILRTLEDELEHTPQLEDKLKLITTKFSLHVELKGISELKDVIESRIKEAKGVSA